MLTKTQFNNYEPGEYTNIRERSFEETIQLIESFPWEQQRDHLQVGLTNPSVTLEDSEGNFLKLALYYNGKFVLHFFDSQQKLYTKSFTRYTEAYPYLRSFYTSQPFATMDFHLENNWLQHTRIHFVDSDFHYRLNPSRIRIYFLRSTGINIVLGLFMLSVGILQISTQPALIFFLPPFIFFIGGGINLVLFSNYFRNAKGTVLTMSKGNDIFYFGSEENPARYDKKEIMMATRYQPPGGRNPIGSFAFMQIAFRNGRRLAIPNILIDDTALMNKLSGFPTQTVRKNWPAIPPASSTLFE